MGRDWKDALYPLKNTVIFIEENNEFIFTKEFASYVKESDMIKIMKGNIARQMFLAHPELKKELWGGHLWNPSYCAVTVSDRSREQVCSYIEGQKEKQ
nr:transposase [uncultured Blautia sp.]